MGETKQDVVNDITDIIGMDRQTLSNGSSIPAIVFGGAAAFVGVSQQNMPATCESIVNAAGQIYRSSFDSRDTPSLGGSTVTLEGLQAMREALRIAADRRAH